MTDGRYAYPPELMRLLVDTIPLICRSKEDVLFFLRGSGTPDAVLTDLQAKVRADPRSISKYKIVSTALDRLNANYGRGDDRALGPLREVTRRVTEFESFTSCWPNDQLKARGLVAEVRSIVNTKDAFTRMQQEREKERSAHLAESEAKALRLRQRRERRLELERQLAALTGWTNAQARGRALEGILNNVFDLDGMHVREAFVLNTMEGSPGEQIDGLIALDGHDYLVEMKWWKDPLNIDGSSGLRV